MANQDHCEKCGHWLKFTPPTCCCGGLFCPDHIHPEEHDCPYEYGDTEDPDEVSGVESYSEEGTEGSEDS